MQLLLSSSLCRVCARCSGTMKARHRVRRSRLGGHYQQEAASTVLSSSCNPPGGVGGERVDHPVLRTGDDCLAPRGGIICLRGGRRLAPNFVLTHAHVVHHQLTVGECSAAPHTNHHRPTRSCPVIVLPTRMLRRRAATRWPCACLVSASPAGPQPGSPLPWPGPRCCCATAGWTTPSPP